MKKRYSIGTLTVAAQEIVRATNKTITIDSIHVVNHSGGNSTFSLYHVPSGESVADQFLLYDITQVRPAIPVRLLDPRIYVEPGDVLLALAADASAIAMTIYGTDA